MILGKLARYWGIISKQGVTADLSPLLARRITLTNQYCAFTVLAIVFFIFLDYASGLYLYGNINWLVLLPNIYWIFLNRLCFFDLSRLCFILYVNLVIFFYAGMGKSLGLHLFYFPLICVTFIIFDFSERKKIILCTICSTILISILECSDFSLIQLTIIPPKVQAIVYTASFVATLALTLLCLYHMIVANYKVESALINSKEYLNNIINAIPDPVFVKDEHHNFILVNSAYTDLTGITTEERLTNGDFELFTEEEAGAFQNEDDLIIAQGGSHNAEVSFINARGEKKTVITSKALLLDEEGKKFVVGAIRDISDRKLAEEKIKESEARLKFSQELAHIGSWEYDLLTKKAAWSDETFRIFGLEPSATPPSIHEYQQMIHPEDIEEHRKFIQRAGIDGISYQHDHRIIAADGTLKFVHARGIPYYNEAGKIVKVVGSILDISERKEVEIALQENEKRFSSLVRYSTDVTTILDIDGNIGYTSPSFYRILGFTEEEVIGEHIFEFLHPEDRNDLLKALTAVMSEKAMPFSTELRYQRENGSWLTVDAIFNNLLEDEAVKGIVVNARDITERKNTEAESKDKSQLLAGIISNMPVVVYKIDPQGVFTEIVGAGLKTLGVEQNQLAGVKIYDAYPEYGDIIDEAFRGKPVTFISTGKRNDEVWYFENYLFEDISRKGGIVGFSLDVTAQKQAEENQKAYSAELEKINRELDQFAYVVSHDLKAPLRAISNLSEWIEEEIKDLLTGEVQHNMMLLRGRVKRMQDLINGILEYSRTSRTKIEYEKVNVDKLIKELLGILGIPERFTVKVCSTLPVIVSNRICVEQIFSNLISNAVKYHDKERGNIVIDYEDKTTFHQFSVTDDGPGISPEFHEKIFVIFQTLHARDKFESTGVGLAIVKKIIEEQGGKIWIESEAGKGAKFIFTIPK